MDKEFQIKNYYKSELAREYGISLTTFRRLIEPIVPELIREYDYYRNQKLLLTKQVRRIVDHLSEPY